MNRASGSRRKRVRLRDVAERAGVSIGTASNAFNRPELISRGLRERVLTAALALGYAGPDPAGRRLRTGRAGALGLIFTGPLPFAFTDPAAPLFLRGLARGMEGARSGLLIIPTSPSREQATQAVREAAVDGFIVYSSPTDDPRVEGAIERRLPIVVVDQPRSVAAPFVGIDDRAAASGAAEHVRTLGHERVAVLAFAEAAEEGLTFDVTAERLAGYREGLADVWETASIHECRPNSPERARKVAADFLDGAERPTAVLAMSDAMAIGTLEAANERAISVPDELSIVGFDDVPAAHLTAPPLTTVAQPHERKGELAAALLLPAIETGASSGNGERTVLATELVVRASTGPPPTRRRKG